MLRTNDTSGRMPDLPVHKGNSLEEFINTFDYPAAIFDGRGMIHSLNRTWGALTPYPASTVHQLIDLRDRQTFASEFLNLGSDPDKTLHLRLTNGQRRELHISTIPEVTGLWLLSALEISSAPSH